LTYCKDFHDLAYNSKKRQDLIRGITQFTNKSLSLVVPLGDFDEDLLNPVVEWMRKKTRLKMAKINQKKSLVQKSKDINNNNKKKIDLFLMKKETSQTHSGNSNLNEMNKKVRKISEEKDNEDDGDDKVEFDPFKRTGCLFGSLFNEIKYRYSKYSSDITDAFNLHTLLAIVFIFTVCVAPSLCFGGILGNLTLKLLVKSMSNLRLV
jgi:hypothetical protein